MEVLDIIHSAVFCCPVFFFFIDHLSLSRSLWWSVSVCHRVSVERLANSSSSAVCARGGPGDVEAGWRRTVVIYSLETFPVFRPLSPQKMDLIMIIIPSWLISWSFIFDLLYLWPLIYCKSRSNGTSILLLFCRRRRRGSVHLEFRFFLWDVFFCLFVGLFLLLLSANEGMKGWNAERKGVERAKGKLLMVEILKRCIDFRIFEWIWGNLLFKLDNVASRVTKTDVRG